MDTADQEDQQLIASIAQGDEAALQALLRKYSTNLFDFAVSVADHHDFAQEAVSNVFISLWQRREKLAINGAVRTYLLAATSYQALKIRNRMPLDEVCIDDVPPQEVIGETAADHELKYDEIAGILEAVLKTMPPLRRKVFQMNRFENLRYKEIAATLGISVVGVQKHMIRARRQLAVAFQKLGYGIKTDPENPGRPPLGPFQMVDGSR